LVPSGMEGMKTLITKGGGAYNSEDYVAAAANPAGTLLVAYIPPGHRAAAVEVDMTVLQGSIQAHWYDPTSGNIVKIAGSPFTNKGKQHFTLPPANSDGAKDWVLVLKPAGD